MTNKRYTEIIFINFLIFLSFIIFIEVSLRLFLSRSNFPKLAIFEFTEKVKTYIDVHQFGGTKKVTNLPEYKCFNEAYNNKNKYLSEILYSKYENGFREFLEISKNSKIILLYLPSDEEDLHKSFFNKIANKYSVEFFDLSQDLRNSSEYNVWSLHPENGHLSRFGNQIIAKTITSKTAQIFKNRKPNLKKKNVDFSQINSTLIASKSNIWNIMPSMPYRVYTNKNGFRNQEDIRKEANHIIVYGDSFTFGPYLPNHDTYTSLSNKYSDELFPNLKLQFLNAGIAGTTIFHQIEILKSTIKLNPELIFLQVLDNDISGVFYLSMRRMSPVKIHDKTLFKPSNEERVFISQCQ